MRKLKLLSLIIFIFIIGFGVFGYFSYDKTIISDEILAVDDFSKDADYDVLFDANGGHLIGFETSDYVKLREGVYALTATGSPIQSVGVMFSKLDTKAIMYWSLDHKCSTKDLEVGANYERSTHKVYYACYEQSGFDNDGIRYVQGGAYVSGEMVNCGDAIKVTKCYQEIASTGREFPNYKEYCEFNEVSIGNKGKFTPASGIVYRTRIGNSPVATCTNMYKAYFYYDTTDINCGSLPGASLSGGNCLATSDSKNIVSTPDTRGSSNFIGWAAAPNKESVNCNGTLVNSSTITLTSDVNYYACYKEDIVEECENSDTIKNGKGKYEVKVCYNAKANSYGEIKVTPIDADYDEILKCASGYKLDDVSRSNIKETTCTKQGDCYRVYDLKCVGSQRPKISAKSAMVGDNNKGTIEFTASSDVGIKGYYWSNYYEKPTVKSDWTLDSSGEYSIESTPGTVFLWVIDNDDQISYAAMASVIDKVTTDTTVSSLEIKTGDGQNLNAESYAFGDVYDGITSSDYVRLSNKINDDSKILASGFNPFDTAYKVTTSSDKITVYATLTSNDASYVDGYEPRTVNLDYGVNTVLIRIQNKAGKIRTYTIIVTREDDRDATNLLKTLIVSKGKLEFDPYKNDYVVSVGKNTNSVSINGELSSTNASYVDGFGPRKVELKNSSTTVALKVKSETGSVRAYTITFVKNGEESRESNDVLLASLSLSKAYIAFDKNVYEYNTTVDYEIDSIDIYALAENGGDSVTLYRTINGETEILSNKGLALNVGSNNITIIVANKDGKTRTYSVNILRKENGLQISSDTALSMLDVDGYDIEFDPAKFDYEIKIKREKTLVIAATPMSNRAEVYIRGNDNLTAFSTVRIKVVAEDGQSKEYTIDIKKDAFNKKIETIGLISGVIIIICGIIIIRVKKRRKSINDYYAE